MQRPSEYGPAAPCPHSVDGRPVDPSRQNSWLWLTPRTLQRRWTGNSSSPHRMRRNLIDFPPWRKSRGSLQNLAFLPQDLILAPQPLHQPPGPPAVSAAALDLAHGACRASAAASKGRRRGPWRSPLAFDRPLQPTGFLVSVPFPNRRCGWPMKCSSFLQKSLPHFPKASPGSFEGGRGTGPERLRFSALRFSSAVRSASASPPRQLWPPPRAPSLASRILAKRFCLSAIRSRAFRSPRRLAPWSLSSCASAASAASSQRSTSASKLRLTRLHAFVAHRLVFGGVRLDLRAVERDMPQLRQRGFFRASSSTCKNSSPQRRQMTLPEVGDRARIWRVVRQ